MLASTTGSRPARLLSAAIAVMALSACSDGADSTSGPPASSPPASTPSSATSTPSEVQTSGSATASASESASETAGTVAPATGALIAVRTSSFRVPEGWVEDGGISKDQNSARRPGGGGLITVNDMDAFGAPAPLDDRVQVELAQAPKGAQRLPNVTLGDDGTLAGVITYREGGTTVTEVMTERGGRVVNVEFALRPSDLKADPDLVESVLASWGWVAGGSS